MSVPPTDSAETSAWRLSMSTAPVTRSTRTGSYEHHTLACFRFHTQGIDHHSYEAGDWNTLRDWCDRFAARRIPLMWGPGRHGPGNNLFAFIEDPDGNWIDITDD